MAKEILMPKLGFSEGDLQVVKWLKQEGEQVTEGEPLVEVMGDKITNDIDAPMTGILHKVLVPEGETVPIGTVLAIIGAEGEDVEELVQGAAAKGKPAEPKPAPPKAEEKKAEPVAEAGEKQPEPAIKASPVARRLAKEYGIDLAAVAATLPAGKRVQGDDVEAYRAKMAATAEAPVPGGYKEIKLAGMRKTIAERMAYSTRETAPVTLMRSLDVTKLWELRNKMKADLAASGERAPSYNDFVMKAVAYALQEHPNLNATYEDGVIRVYEDINLSFAVALEDGLITPVIRNVDKKGVREISAEAAELAAKAREGTLEAKDLQDGTFTVTNLGMYGIEVSTPIINPPQVGILAVGSIQPYLVLEEDTVVLRYKLQLSLTVDHRIIDGAPGAEFLQTVAKYLETPYRLLG